MRVAQSRPAPAEAAFRPIPRPLRFSAVALALLGAALLIGCATRSVQSPQGSPRLSDAEAERRAEAFARFAAGVSHDLNNDPRSALAEFERSVALDPANEVLLQELAARYVQLGENQKAITLLAEASKSPTASAETLGVYGRTALLVGQTNQAIAACNAAIAQDPLALDPYQTLAEVYFRLGQPTNSLAVIHRAAAQKEQAPPYFLVGTVDLYAKFAALHPAFAEQLRSPMRSLLEAALAMRPNNLLLLSQIAGHYTGLGDAAKAMEIYEQMVGGLGNIPLLRDAALEKLANYYLGHGEFEKAETHLESIVRDNPTQFPQAYYFLGSIAAKDGRFEKAEDHLRRFLLLNPGFEPAYYELARAQVAQERSREALETLHQAKTRFSASFLGEFLGALALGQLDDTTNAVARMVSAEILARGSNPSMLSAQFYFQLGAMQERAKLFEDSERSFRKSLEMAPDSAETLNYLGYMWADRGENLEEALALIEKALTLEPDNAAYLDSLAWVLHRLGRHDEALPPMRRSIELSDEPDPVLFDHLGDILSALGQVQEAREAWQKSVSQKPDPAVRKKLEESAGPGTKTD
jgi:tetratricopeptide (TPR) repeat protein